MDGWCMHNMYIKCLIAQLSTIHIMDTQKLTIISAILNILIISIFLTGTDVNIILTVFIPR